MRCRSERNCGLWLNCMLRPLHKSTLVAALGKNAQTFQLFSLLHFFQLVWDPHTCGSEDLHMKKTGNTWKCIQFHELTGYRWWCIEVQWTKLCKKIKKMWMDSLWMLQWSKLNVELCFGCEPAISSVQTYWNSASWCIQRQCKANFLSVWVWQLILWILLNI